MSGPTKREPAEPAIDSRLYIFPHAGGSADFYLPFAKAFTSDIKHVAVRYPGRRAGKDLSRYTSIPELADRLCAMLEPAEAPAGRLAFFGHSMGGLLAFELALRFEAAGNPIAALFVSACAAPGRLRYAGDLQGSDRDLLTLVSGVTGANPEFLHNDEFAATLLPTLRGLKAIAAYQCPPGATVSCPIYGLMADDDELATADVMQPWRAHTTSDFELAVFGGDHFYLNGNLPGVAHWVEERALRSVRAAVLGEGRTAQR